MVSSIWWGKSIDWLVEIIRLTEIDVVALNRMICRIRLVDSFFSGWLITRAFFYPQLQVRVRYLMFWSSMHVSFFSPLCFPQGSLI